MIKQNEATNWTIINLDISERRACIDDHQLTAKSLLYNCNKERDPADRTLANKLQ